MEEVNGIALTATDRPHFYIATGLNFNLIQGVTFEPNLLYRFVNGTSNLATAFININFNNKMKIGTGISNNNYVAGLILFTGLSHLDIGYGYQMGQPGSMQTLNSNSHEIIIKYKLD